MFEKFTQKAIDVVILAQNYAKQFCHTKVLSQHLLIGLIVQSKGVQAKILSFDKINFGELSTEVLSSAPVKSENQKSDNVFFSQEARDVLKSAVEYSIKFNSRFVLPQHIAIALFENKNFGAYKILKKFDIDEEKIIANLKRILDKSSDIKNFHPEIDNEETKLENINDFFKEKEISDILSNAQTKLSARGYEIVGSEQLVQSILDNPEYKIVEILSKYGINSQTFCEKLSQFDSRKAEFENSEKQIIFTPNAFSALLSALDIAKESGNVAIKAQHIILGILKSKAGIAYKILSQYISNIGEFEMEILKNIDDKTCETNAILRLSKQEAMNLNCSTVGTEMILLGILSYGSNIAYDTLKRLGITLKDARNEVKKLITPQKDLSDLTYSQRAKKALEIAYKSAKEHNKSKIKSENILYALTKVPNCLAMQVLINLGTDVLEIRQGIKQELLGWMDL